MDDIGGVDVTDRTCSEDGCERPHYARGLCQKHYRQWWSAGGIVNRPIPALERFKANVNVYAEGGCWEWMGLRDAHGYGKMNVDGQSMLVHRFSWLTFRGPIPPDKPNVLHHCDNPPCCNPSDDHLFVGTQADNIHDMIDKGRRYAPGPPAFPCGTAAAYTRHIRNGEVACEPCHAAYLAYLADYRERRRADGAA